MVKFTIKTMRIILGRYFLQFLKSAGESPIVFEEIGTQGSDIRNYQPAFLRCRKTDSTKKCCGPVNGSFGYSFERFADRLYPEYVQTRWFLCFHVSVIRWHS